MKKIVNLLLLSLLAFVVVSCDDKEDDKPTILLNYLAGSWEVVYSDNRECPSIYDITAESSSLPSAGSVGYNGTLTTFYFTVDHSLKRDKTYSWKIVAVEDVYYPLIELVWVTDIDANNEDTPADRFYYRIEELTPNKMRWHISSAAGKDETIIFERRTDSENIK
ncbi:MAG: hypothetical protein NC453_30805 [Muribaculum sp.]|nr:hypothetical protein [Muribaculum sp.]